MPASTASSTCSESGPQYQSSATRASSDMRSGVHGGSKTMLTVTLPTPGDEADGVLDPARHLAGDRAARRGQRHVDVDVAVVVDVDAVDQAELVDVGRNFRVVDRLQRRRRCRAVSRSSSSGGIAEPVACSVADAPRRGPRPSRRRPGGAAGAVAVSSMAHGSQAKKSWAFCKGLGKAVDLVEGVVEPEGGAAGRGHAEAGEQRLGAMGAGPHRDALAVDDRRDVVRVGAGHVEGDDRALALRRRRRWSGC